MIDMNRIVLCVAATSMAFGICTSCAAYDCTDAESYRNGLQALKLGQLVAAENLGVAVKFVQKQNGVDFGTALQQVMQTGTSEQTRIYDDQLADIGARIKVAKHDSPQTCAALLVLQRQYSDVGQQKMNFIVKLVTGENSEPADSDLFPANPAIRNPR